MKKIKKRTPGGKLKIVKRRKKPTVARCAVCGAALQGMPRLEPSKLRKVTKTRRRPSRPYGGYLCTRCMRELFKKKALEKR